MNGWKFLLLIIVAGTGLSLLAATPPSASPLKAAPPAMASLSPTYVGAQSCSTSACHGSLITNPQADGIRFDEYYVWMNDPHAKAYRVLFAPRSLRMFQQLQVMSMDGEIVDPDRFHACWKQCIACHNPSHPMDKPAVTEQGTLIPLPGEGVGCEGCHGPAGEWLHRHYRKDWKNLTLEKKASLGFELTQTLPGRARSCASCHIGDQDREVNHDLIAAGHPALKFELTWYEQRLPPHWNPNRRVGREPALEKWLAGQLIGAEENLHQLRRRAEASANPSHPGIWPEFGEYRCFACHHDLVAKGGWSDGSAVMPFGPWDLTLSDDLAQVFPSARSKEFQHAHRQLVEAMNSNPFGKPQRITPLVTQALKTLSAWNQELNPSSEEIADAIRKLTTLHADTSWEWDAQLFLALAAPHRGQASDCPEELETLRKLLSFPVTQESQFDSPRDYLSIKSSVAGEDDSTLQTRSRKLIEGLMEDFGRD